MDAYCFDSRERKGPGYVLILSDIRDVWDRRTNSQVEWVVNKSVEGRT